MHLVFQVLGEIFDLLYIYLKKYAIMAHLKSI